MATDTGNVEWSEAEEDYLVEMWRKRVCLFDTTSKAYSNRQAKRTAIEEIASRLEKPESFYDAPASIFSILDHVSEHPETQEQEKISSSSSTNSSSSSSSSSQHGDSTLDRRAILHDSHDKGSNSGSTVVSVEEGVTQLTRYNHWENQIQPYRVITKQIVPIYLYPKSYKRRPRRKELVLHKGSALKDFVIFFGILTIILIMTAVFTALYFGLEW